MLNKGESAEEALVREMSEEIGVKPIYYQFQASSYFEKSNTLIINFYAILESEEITPNHEIDEYSWYNLEDGFDAIKEALLAKKFFEYYMNNK